MGVETPELNSASTVSELIGNKDGNTVRIAASALAAQLSLDAIAVNKETRAQLYADLGWAAGTRAAVWGDTTEAQRGIYLKSGAAGSGSWSRIGDLPQSSLTTEQLAGKADTADVAALEAADAAETAARIAADNAEQSARIAADAILAGEIDARTSIADVSDTVQGEAVRLVVTGPDGRKYILVHIDDDGTTTFARPVSLPSGSLPLSAIDTDDLAALPFSLSTSILLSSMRIVAEGPDGRQYILMDIPVDGSSPIDTYVSRALSGGTGGGASTDTIVAVGDSMTAAGSGIIDVLPGRFPGRLVVDSAEGGERTEGIAVSFGVPDLLTYAVTGNAIPTSGTVNVTPNISHLNSGASALVDIIGETGLAVRCRVHNNAGTYQMRPVAYPAAAIRLQSPARARVVSLQVSGSDPTLARLLDPLYDGTAIFRDGRNDIGYDKGYDGAALIALTQRMVALMRSGRYIVLGVTNGTSDVPTANGGSSGTISEANSLISLSNVVDLNSRRAAAFPGRFFSPMANFQDAGQTDTITVSGQSFEMTDAAVLVDGLHENATGKSLTCDLIEAAFAALEY